MKVKVDVGQLNLDKRTQEIKVASNAGTRLVAEAYRDELKKNFIEASQGSRYEARSAITVGSPQSITHGLVVSNSALPEHFTVGPKIGGMNTASNDPSKGKNTGKNFLTYETLMEYNEDGTGDGKPWTFKLLHNRGSASGTDGYWTTYGIKPKKFFEKTYTEYARGKLQTETMIKVAPLVERSLQNGNNI